MSLVPGQKIKPPFEEKDAVVFVRTNYQLNVKQVKTMNSYDDKNFLIFTDMDARFTLKVSNSLDSSVPNLVDTMNELLFYVHNQGVAVPVPMLTAECNGKQVSLTYEQLDPSSKDRYAIRLLSFIEGILLIEVPYTSEVLENVGRALAKLNIAMSKFDSDVLKQRTLTWSLLNIPLLKNFVFAIDDFDKRKMIENIICDFDSRVLSNLQSFKLVLIHGDFNEQNILVKKNQDGEFDVCGILDFGDTHYAPQLFDIAIACTYAMLECKTMDVIEAPRYVLKGYLQIINLTAEEWKILPLCVLARLAQSLTLGAYSYKCEPDEYVLTTARTGWSVLERLLKMEHEELVRLWKE